MADAAKMQVTDEGRNGILFEGELGRIFVNRGLLTGKPVDDLATARIELLLRLLQWAFNGLCHVGHGAACRRVGRILSLHDEEQCPA